jgi:hypothetical protein
MICQESTSEKQRLLVIARADQRCEAEVYVSTDVTGEEVWARCFRRGIEVHHMLTRARGGDLLDMAGEDYHLAGLCPRHHQAAHGPGGRDQGLLIDGYVTVDHGTGLVIYTGPDDYLLQTYGRVA